MRHLISIVLLVLATSTYGQQTTSDSTANGGSAADSTRVMKGFPIVMGYGTDATVTFLADSCLDNKHNHKGCSVEMEFAMADSTICISEGDKQKELRIIDYTEWQPFEDFEEPWEMQDPLLFYRGYKKYFMAKERGRREPYDISMYRTANGDFCIVMDDCGTWTLFRPVRIENIIQ